MKYFVSLSLITCMLSGSLQAAHKSMSIEDVKKVQEKIKTRDYLSVRFTQLQFKSMRGRSVKSEGYAKFGKPASFRWVIEKPSPLEWIFDGKEIVNFDPAQKNASKFKSNAPQAAHFRHVAQLVLNWNELLSYYNLSDAEDNGDLYHLNLIPKEKNADIERIAVEISAKDYFVKKIVLEFQGGNRNTIQFTDQDTSKIPDEVFKFTAPKGVKINEIM